MKILVCISNVPDTTSKITFTNDNANFNSTGVQYIINPYDEIALTRAIELCGETSGSVTVINVGELSTEPVIRKALASGADDAVRINAAPRDAWFVANQLADYAKNNAYDIILTGRESIDYNGTQMASMLGELLAIPSVSIAKKIEIQGNTATIEREIEGGKEVLSVSLPFVAGAAEGVAEPKIPNIRGIMAARSKPLQVIEPVSVPELSNIQKFETPAPRGTVKLVPAEDPQQLVDLLHSQARVI